MQRVLGESPKVLGEDKFAIQKIMPKCVCQAKDKIPSPNTKNPDVDLR